MDSAPKPVRMDKWLWAVRLYKTRGAAADACRSGRVVISGHAVKPSREIKPNDLVVIQLGEITRTVKVLAGLEQRVGASLVGKYLEDLTPASEYEKLKQPVLPPLFFHPKRAGRPTKKDRRKLGKLQDLF